MKDVGACTSQREPGRTCELQKKVAVPRYLLYHVRKSRLAYYPDGSGGGLEGEAHGGNAEESAAVAAASGAEGLADSLRSSVRVSDLLDCLASREAGNLINMAAIADAPTWGSVLKDASKGVQQPREGLELYLCERLLPLLDAGIAALCEYIEKLQADKRQFQLQPHGERRKESQQLYLIRHGKAAAAFARARSPSSKLRSEVRDIPDDIRGEHIRLCELPVFEVLAAEVRDERGWRAVEALRPQTEFLYQHIKQSSTHEMHQELSQGQQGEEQLQEQPQGRAQFPAENLPTLLQAIDSAWGLPEGHGFFAAAIGQVEDAEEGDKPANSLASKSKEEEEFYFLNSSEGLPESSILGACTRVTLEVANADNVTFPEVWRFLACCLEECLPLKQQAFARALNISTRNSSLSTTMTTHKEPAPARA
ncbi:hypothetical protein Esti_001511 [Eimeria stiedai]